VMNVVMQANPLVSTPQQFADTITIGLIEVDAYYPPNLPLLTFVGNNGLALTFVGSNGGAVEFSGT